MDALQTVGPLLGVVVGGLLTGVTSFLKSRKERKRLLAVALSDLLEIRHRLVSVDLVIRSLRSRVDVQPEAMLTLRNLSDSLFPNEPGLNERYDAAVTMLASIDPVLGFRLRSKNSLPTVLAALRNHAATSGANLAHFETLETALRIAATPTLDAAVLELAKAHSLFTGRKVKKLMTGSVTLPIELEQFLGEIGPEKPAVEGNGLPEA